MTTPRWYMVNEMGMATLCSDKDGAEKEEADAQMAWPHMGPHRAVQLVEAADVEAMRAGYAAARLEIESLRGRAGWVPAAAAQQPGTAGIWEPLPGTLPEPEKPVLLDIGKKYPIRAMWVQKFMLPVGMEDDSGFGEYDEATDTYYCPEGWYEWNEHEETHWAVDETPTAWCELPPNGGASHGQAPAQAAPDVSGYVSEWASGICTADEAMAGIAKLYGARVAPTTQPAPQQEARPVTPYTCPKCHALWLHWPAEQSGFGVDTLNCRSATHCDYCEKGGVEQLERLERVPAAMKAPQQEAQEPVGYTHASWIAEAKRGGGGSFVGRKNAAFDVPIYTAPQPSPTPQADSVQDLQPVHDAVTIDLLNERVVYLERKLKEADSVLEDAARLDWLALAGPTSICVVIDREHDGEVEVSTDDVTGYGKTLREALDKARKQGGA